MFLQQLGLIYFILLKGYETTQAPLQFIQEPEAGLAFSNEKGLTLNCTASGDPPPVTGWTCDNGPCPDIPGLRTMSHDKGSLSFLPFQPPSFRPLVHNAVYRCEAGNGFGRIVKDVAVRAVILGQVRAEVEGGRAGAGEPALLKCALSPPTYPATLLWWTRDEDLLLRPPAQNNKYLVLPNGHLIVWKVGLADVGSRFQCLVGSNLGQDMVSSPPGRIILQESGRSESRAVIRDKVESLVVEEGELVVIPCISQGNPKPLVRWQKELSSGPTILLQNTFDETRPEDGNKIQIRQNVLSINAVAQSHAGKYICNATNQFGSDLMEVHLSVRSRLSAEIVPVTLSVEHGGTGEFSCLSGDESADIEWLKDGVPLRDGPLASRVRFVGRHTIMIFRVTKEDQGMLQCLAKNSFETQQAAAQLYLRDSRPSLLYMFIQQTVVSGTIISLRCVASGIPLPTISWTLDGFPLPQSERFLLGQYVSGDSVTAHVNITSILNADSGEYKCLAKNRVGETFHAARVNVYGQLMVRRMPDVVAVSGQSLKLKCAVGGYPIQKIEWTKDGVQMTESISEKLFEDGTLIIDNVVKDDAGLYKCAGKRQNQEAQGFVAVQVIAPASITPFSFGSPELGGRVSIFCSVTSHFKNLQITWLRNSASLNSDTGVQIRKLDDFTSSLTIPSLTPRFHNGNYTCQINDIDFHISSAFSAYLSVNVPPRITPFLLEDNVGVGQKVQVLCFSLGDLPLQFSWTSLENGPLLKSGYKISAFSPNSEILTINNVTKEMSGTISCQVSNLGGTAVHSSKLLVKVPPQWVTEPADVVAMVGSSVKVSCAADGIPTPTTKWLQMTPGHKDYRDTGTLPGIRSLNGTLSLSQIKKEASGMIFLCHSTNGIRAPLTKRVKLTVNAPPRILRMSDKEVVQLGKSVRLGCETDGDQPIRIIWKARGVEINPGDPRYIIQFNGSRSFLTIPRITSSDSTEFSCIANNTFGHDMFHISILVQDKPGVPSNLQILKATSRSVSIAWEAQPFVLDFIILYHPARSSGNSTEVPNKHFVHGDEAETSVKHLLPYTLYDFRICARNQIGTSELSDPVLIRTDQEPPGSPPINITVEGGSGSNELRVAWLPPEPKNANGEITSYYVYYKKERDVRDQERYKVVRGRHLSTVLRRLEPFNTQYYVSVQAVNAAGHGPNSSLFYARTGEDKPEKPEQVICSSLTPYSIHVSWNQAQKRSSTSAIGYRVFVLLLQDGDNFEFESKVNGLSSVINGLREFSNYKIEVTAFSKAGESEVQTLFCRTRESVPEEPSRLKVVQDAGTGILVWLEPNRPNGLIITYHVYIRIQEGEGQVKTMKKAVSAPKLIYHITHLNPEENYEACVSAENQVGEGKPSQSVTFKSTTNSHGKVRVGILSFGKVLRVTWQTEIHLDCDHIGSPKPQILWKQNEAVLHSEAKTLSVKGSSLKDSSNYSCLVTNGDSTDQISYTVHVQVPPSRPAIYGRGVNNSVRLHWRGGESGERPKVLGFKLSFRQEGGEWEEIELGSKSRTYEILHTECFGAIYESYVTSFNEIGTSVPSETIRVEAQGYLFVPDQPSFLSYNSSSITLNFSSWNFEDCETGSLSVEYREVGESWILASQTLFTDIVQIRDLREEKDYRVKVRLEVGLGELKREYSVPISKYSSIMSADNLSSISLSFSTLIPMGAGVLIVLVGIYIVLALCRRRIRRGSEGENNVVVSSLHKPAEDEYSMIRRKYMADCGHMPVADDVHPYATFNLHDGPTFAKRRSEVSYGRHKHKYEEELEYGERERRRGVPDSRWSENGGIYDYAFSLEKKHSSAGQRSNLSEHGPQEDSTGKRRTLKRLGREMYRSNALSEPLDTDSQYLEPAYDGPVLRNNAMVYGSGIRASRINPSGMASSPLEHNHMYINV